MIPNGTVIIPCRNEQRIRSTLESLLSTVAVDRTEIIVVDDGSTDDCCSRLPAPIKVLKTSGVGCAAAKNIGAMAAQGETLAFCDAHMTFEPDWYGILVDALGRGSKTAFVVPRIAVHDNPDAVGCGMAFVETLPIPQFPIYWLSPSQPTVVPLGGGACQLWRAAIFHRLTGFNGEMAPWGGEDVEISLRAALFGYNVIAAPESHVSHVFQDAFSPDFDSRYAVANDLRTALIHFTARRITRILSELASQWPTDDFAFIYEYACTPRTIRTRLDIRSERVLDDTAWFASHDHLTEPQAVA